MAGNLLYARFSCADPRRLCEQLPTVAPKELIGNDFRAFLWSENRGNFYHLTLEELGEWLDRHPDWERLVIQARGKEGASLRIQCRLEGKGSAGSAYLLIGSASPQLQQQLLSRLQATPIGASRSREIPSQASLAPSVTPLEVPSLTFDRPTLRVVDAFRFNPDFDGPYWDRVLTTLSREYLGAAPYHLEIRTQEGDHYLRVTPEEWDYFFSEGKHRLREVLIEACAPSGESLWLRLHFHPLHTGPNAEVEILSSRPEAIKFRLEDMLGQPEAAEAPHRWHEAFRFQPHQLDLPLLMEAVREISREFFQRVPPTAFLRTQDGLSFTGLSLYQLSNWYERLEEHWDLLSLGVNRPYTGQTFSLLFEYSPIHSAPQASLHLMWGSEDLHHRIRERLLSLVDLEPCLQPPIEPTTESPPLKYCAVGLSWQDAETTPLWQRLESGLKENGWTPLPLRSLYAHHKWEDSTEALHRSALLIVDLSDRHPDGMFQAGFARATGKTVLLLSRDASAVPVELSELPLLLYEHSLLGRELLAQALEDWLAQALLG